jgi:L-ascorbate metabolism protein UlaG (beta-lactamase superfamily)
MSESTSPAPSRLRRALKWTLRGSALGVLGVVYLGGCVFAAPTYEGPESDHFDGERFFNHVTTEGRFTDFVRWRLNRDAGPWDEWIESEPGAPPPERVTAGGLRATFVNHSTVLLQMDGLNVLTDPVWSERVSPVSFTGPRRKRAPGLRFEDLPPIDVVLISHNHYDHLDVPTLRCLAASHAPRVLAGLGNAQYLTAEGIGRAEDLDWMEGTDAAPGVRITCVPAQHFSGRGLTDRNGTLWCGFVIEGPSGAVYFAGDTGYGPHFAQAREDFGPFRLALLPIGSYRPEWFMAPVHTSPAEAVRAHHDLGAATSIGIHFGTFALGDDGQHEPLTDLEAALAADPIDDTRFWTLENGEGCDVPPLR